MPMEDAIAKIGGMRTSTVRRNPLGSLQSLLEPRPCVPQRGSTIEDEPLGLR